MQGGQSSLIGATVARRHISVDSCRGGGHSGSNCESSRDTYRDRVEQILSADAVPSEIKLGVSQHPTDFLDTDILPSLTEGQLQRLLCRLASVSHVKLVDFSMNKIEKGAFVEICGLLLVQTSLQELYLNATAITDECCIALSETLLSLTSLLRLGLSGNLISNVSCRGLANALLAQTSLRHLDLGNNPCIGDEGAFSLIDAISVLTCLESIDLSGTCISHEACAALCKVLRSHRCLKSLHLNRSARSVVRCDAWSKRGLPRVPDDIVCDHNDWFSLLKYIQVGPFAPVFQMPIMIIGDEGVGKTSLIKALSSDHHRTLRISGSQRTGGVGMESTPISLPAADFCRRNLLKLHLCDFTGVDFHYFLAQTPHFTRRCLFCLLWTACKEDEYGEKKYLTLEQIMSPLRKWLQLLAWNVPESKILIIGTHCGTSPEKFAAIKSEVDSAICAEIERLNRVLGKEAASTRSLYHGLMKESSEQFAIMMSKIKSTLDGVGDTSLSWSRYDLKQTQLALESKLALSISDACEFLLSQKSRVHKLSECSTTPRSIRCLAAHQYRLLRDLKRTRRRHQVLHGNYDGLDPHESAGASELVFVKGQSYCVDSLDECGIRELLDDIEVACRDMPLMGEEVPQSWIEVMHALQDTNCFAIYGNYILSMELAVSRTKSALEQLRRQSPHADCHNLSDRELCECLEYCDSLGLAFVYKGHFLRDPKLLVELIKPLVHDALKDDYPALFMTSQACNACENDLFLLDLHEKSVLDHRLLRCLKAWTVENEVNLSVAHNAILSFLNKSYFLRQLSDQPGCSLVTVRLNRLGEASKIELDGFASKSVVADFHAMYVFPFEHIGFIACIHAAVRTLKPEDGLSLTIRCFDNSVFIGFASSFCIFTLQSLDFIVPSKLGSIKNVISSKTFSHTLSISCNNDGLFAFAARCADSMMSNGAFGSYYQCWIPYRSSSDLQSVHECNWLMINSRLHLQNGACPPDDPRNRLPMLSAILASNSEVIIPHTSILLKELFPRRSPVFISHVYKGDGTGEFCLRLKELLERRLLCTVWLDKNEMTTGSAFAREMQRGICNACVFIICLTPLYLTRPNCLRELRWAMDICQENPSKRLFILPLHPAATYTGLQFIIKAHRIGLPGQVFLPIKPDVHAQSLMHLHEVIGHSLSEAAVQLLKRLTGIESCDIQSDFIKLQPWCSDLKGPDWEETSKELAVSPTSQFECKSVTLAQLCSCMISQIRKTIEDAPLASSVDVCTNMDDFDLDATPPSLQAVYPPPNIPVVRHCFRRVLCLLSESEVVKLILLGFNDELAVHCVQHDFAKRNDGFGFVAHISGVDFVAARQRMRGNQLNTLAFACFCAAAILLMLDIPFRITEQKTTVCIFSMVIASWWWMRRRRKCQT